jgi:hypothetical protein
VDEALFSELFDSNVDSVKEALSQLLLWLSPPLLVALALSVVVAFTPTGLNLPLIGCSMLFSVAVNLVALAYAELAAAGSYCGLTMMRSTMWMA